MKSVFWIGNSRKELGAVLGTICSASVALAKARQGKTYVTHLYLLPDRALIVSWYSIFEVNADTGIGEDDDMVVLNAPRTKKDLDGATSFRVDENGRVMAVSPTGTVVMDRATGNVVPLTGIEKVLENSMGNEEISLVWGMPVDSAKFLAAIAPLDLTVRSRKDVLDFRGDRMRGITTWREPKKEN